MNRLTSITNPSGETTTFTYDALGRRTSMTHDNGVVTNYSYDAASQLLSLVHQLGATTINSFNYTYDKVGNRETKTDNNGTANYSYDTLNRLVQATNPIPTNPLESFTYDDVGNRVDSNQNGLSTFNDANQLEGDANFTYQYDNNGNQIQKTDKITSAFTLYEYDAEDRLIRVVRDDGSIVNYKYDGLGRRIEKEVDTVVTKYIYDNEDILLELDGSNNIIARYTHGPGIDEPLVMERGGASFFYHADGLTSITDLTDTAGTVAQAYTYSSFGKIESQLDPSFIQPYTFTAREFDPETGLYYYRARTYDPLVGRFLQEDPIGFLGGDVNFYSYVRNRPVVLADPDGTGPIGIAAGVGICVGAAAWDMLSTQQNINKLAEELNRLDQQLRELERQGEGVCLTMSDIERFEKITELEAEKFRIARKIVAAQGNYGSIALVIGILCPALIGLGIALPF